MELRSISIRNYRSLQNVTLTDVPRLLVLVGANGSGKSTFFDVFAFLRDTLAANITKALDARGRLPEVVTRGHENEPISFELRVQVPMSGRKRLVTYGLEITQSNGRPVIEREYLHHGRKPEYLLHFRRGAGFAVDEESGRREEQHLESPDILAIKGLGQFQRFKAASALRQLLENWHVSDFHISAARGRKESTGEAEHLSVSGDNLPRVAQYLFENHRPVFEKIMRRMQQRVPGIEGVTPTLTDDGYLILRFRDGTFKTPLLDRYVSDGTIKMFAYLVLLHDPAPHPLLCIEEPEDQPYPTLMDELAEEFREYARRGGQVMVSTHPPDLLNAMKLEEVYWLVKENGVSAIKRASEDKQVENYMKDGDKMGALWKQGFFSGANPQ